MFWVDSFFWNCEFQVFWGWKGDGCNNLRMFGVLFHNLNKSHESRLSWYSAVVITPSRNCFILDTCPPDQRLHRKLDDLPSNFPVGLQNPKNAIFHIPNFIEFRRMTCPIYGSGILPSMSIQTALRHCHGLVDSPFLSFFMGNMIFFSITFRVPYGVSSSYSRRFPMKLSYFKVVYPSPF